MAEIVVNCLVEHFECACFVVIKRPPTVAGAFAHARGKLRSGRAWEATNGREENLGAAHITDEIHRTENIRETLKTINKITNRFGNKFRKSADTEKELTIISEIEEEIDKLKDSLTED